MLKRFAGIIIICMLLLCGSVCFAQTAPTVSVSLDASSIAQGFIENGRTLVPVRVLSEHMGYRVDWDEITRTVTVSNGDITNSLAIGSYTAVREVNGVKSEIILDAAPEIYNARTYVPLRYIAESLGCLVHWDGEKQMVYIASAMRLQACGADLLMGDLSEKVLIEQIGKPYDTHDGADGIRRLVYMPPENGSMTVFGFVQDTLFEFFTNDAAAKVNGVCVSQMSAQNMPASAKLFSDEHEGARPVAFYMNVSGGLYRPFKENVDKSAVMEQEAKLAYYLTNSLRRLAGKKDMVFSGGLAKVNQAHVAAMTENGFFSHTGLSGDGIGDRIKASPIYSKYVQLSEILAHAPNAYFACYGWLNSREHRDSMLNGNYEYTGICVDGKANENLYYAQVMVKL